MSVQEPHVGTYPAEAFTFWNPKSQKLTIINQEDFPEREILETLGISDSALKPGFGNCDPEEACARQDVMRWLADHPEAWWAIEALAKAPFPPDNEMRFQTHYDDEQVHNPFWKCVHAVLNALTIEDEDDEVEELPERLRTFRDTLESFLKLEADEHEMARNIADLLKTTAVLEGIGTFQVTFNADQRNKLTELWDSMKREERLRKRAHKLAKQKNPDALEEPPKKRDIKYHEHVTVSASAFTEFHGHRTFSFALSQARTIPYPKWTNQPFNPASWLFGEMRRNMVDAENRRLRSRAYRSMAIIRSKEVSEDLRLAIAKMIVDNPKIAKAMFGVTATFTVYFSYGRLSGDYIGMQMRIVHIGKVVSELGHYAVNFKHGEFEGYSPEMRCNIGKIREEMAATTYQLAQDKVDSRFRETLLKIDPRLLDETRCIDSPQTNREHRWMVLENYYASDQAKATYDAMCEFTKFVRRHASTLHSMTVLLNKCVVKAKELGAPLTFPRILTDGQNVVQFTSLYPMHLGQTLKGKKVVPISGLPGINGTMIGLTGAHGGGKTVTEHTITGNVYLAQSGLPVLGESFQLNCRTHMGLVFIEGVSGQSVCELLIGKTKAVFDGIQGVPGGNILLVLDELGSATQEEAGMRVALRVLEELHHRKVSLLFSTQILGVAETAEKRFGAKNFRVDRNHRLLPGIAGGELDKIVAESGLGDHLRS